MTVQQISELSHTIQQNFGQLLVGQEDMVELMLTAILADGHILLEGVPGVAKTLSAKIMARSIQADFSRIQFTPDLMPSDVIGTLVLNNKTLEFEFRKGPIFANIVLIDEINRAPAKTQAALFEVMEERQITVDGFSHIMQSPFLVIATQNPIEQEGTYRLPEAQLDRFLFKIVVDYPNLDEEVEILNKHHVSGSLQANLAVIQALIDRQQLDEMRKAAQRVFMEPKLIRYIAAIVQETRRSGDIYLGASPRASVSILNTAKVWAALKGRDFVIPDDIKAMTKPVMRHRIILTPEKEMEGATPDQVIEKITEKVEVPR